MAALCYAIPSDWFALALPDPFAQNDCGMLLTHYPLQRAVTVPRPVPVNTPFWAARPTGLRLQALPVTEPCPQADTTVRTIC